MSLIERIPDDWRAALSLIDGRHIVIESSHPSPLSATRGPKPFVGSRPFSTANVGLKVVRRDSIDWSLTEAHRSQASGRELSERATQQSGRKGLDCLLR